MGRFSGFKRKQAIDFFLGLFRGPWVGTSPVGKEVPGIRYPSRIRAQVVSSLWGGTGNAGSQPVSCVCK